LYLFVSISHTHLHSRSLRILKQYPGFFNVGPDGASETRKWRGATRWAATGPTHM